ncbi:uncharacterized protein LOC116207566 isoform X2 [Punica granatum]|uniref:Uncharacterized protein LOC116207566 isoform X2 n=1 Tax=Punica granatum TaxID=22663 RepID=A0A6P8DPW1_PUNGR|nr:uncharacterized protein LOC116207566 isoform X2 [Punica granatum]
MPKEIPGFYYDEEKNRYFPVKGPIPGSNSTRKQPSSASSMPATDATSGRARELDGNALHLRTGKKWTCHFETEILNNQVSQPQVWSYDETDHVAEGALEIIPINMITPEGETQIPALLAGSIHGLLSFYVVGKAGEHLVYGVKSMSSRVWPQNGESESEKWAKPPVPLWRIPGAFHRLSSDISRIRSPRKPYSVTSTPCSTASYTLITTLGSDRFGGSVFVLNPVDPFDPHSRNSYLGVVHNVASFNYTIWTADCSSKKNQAVVGTNRGAALVDLENGKVSWVFHSGSDVLAQQFELSGNGVLCGLRNGAILTVDVREGPGASSARLRKHLIPCTPSNKNDRSSTRKWFKINGNIHPTSTTYMPKSVSSLLSLQLYDQYFLASSMDGSIKLYDQRLLGRGPLQSYEGHVNTHTHIQLGVDPSEKFVVSGGEDHSLRVWNIRSGKLLFEKKVFSSYPLTLCTQTDEGSTQERGSCMQYLHEQGNCWGSWHGSRGGLFYTRWC